MAPLRVLGGTVVLCQLGGAAGHSWFGNLLESPSSSQRCRDIEIQQIPAKGLPQFSSGVPVRQVIPEGLVSEMWGMGQFVTLKCEPLSSQSHEVCPRTAFARDHKTETKKVLK